METSVVNNQNRTSEFLNFFNSRLSTHQVIHQSGIGMKDIYNNASNPETMSLNHENIHVAQGGYTSLLLGQISQSQEEAKFANLYQGGQESFTKMLLGNDTMEDTTGMQSMQSYYNNLRNYEMTTDNDVEKDSTWDTTYSNGSDNYIEYANSHYEQEDVQIEDNNGDDDENANWQLDLLKKLQVEQVATNIHSQQSRSATKVSEKSESRSSTDEDMQGLSTENNNQEEENGSQELTEEEVEAFIRSEEIAASEGNNASLDSKYVPQIGQEFKDRNDAHHFFNFYAFIAGFAVVITHTARTTSRKRNNEVFKVEMKCHKHGKGIIKSIEGGDEQRKQPQQGPKRNTNVLVKTNCPVVMVVKEMNGIWRITKLDLDHNHEVSPSSRTQLFSGHKYMTDMEKGIIRTLNDNNIETRKMIAILSYLRGGLTALPYKMKNVSNFRTKINREVTGNDMMQALAYFRKKQSEDPTFFYRFDVNEKMKVRNLFWTDGSSLKLYAEYGDCVSFDTTFMTNKYNLPFAPFVGITGHGHTCLFACAFLADETTDTFKWVFECFLEAMGGKHPKTIITDQDGAMKAAIAKVFPHTRHRNCMFHIKTKCYNKNGKCFAKNEGLHEEFEDIINNSIIVEEFQELWQDMIAKYELQNIKYLNKMWIMRERFIPVYFKRDFFPFLTSTGRSEGTNARFKNNVGPTYSVTSFLKEYQRIMDTINMNEDIEDNESKQKRPKELIFDYTIEHQAMEMYNRNIFRKFQIQLRDTARLSYREIERGQEYEVYQKPNSIYKEYRKRSYKVKTNLTKDKEEFSCICGKFEKDGILCSHILKIIVEEDISKIPEKYILERWRKKDKKVNMQRRVEKTTTHRILRFNILSRKAAILASKGSSNDETLDYLLQEFETLEKNLDMLLSPVEITSSCSEVEMAPQTENQTSGSSNNVQEPVVLKDPERIKQKGRPKKPTRLKTLVEDIKVKLAIEEKKKTKKKKGETSSPQGKSKKRMRKGAGNTSKMHEE